MLADEFGSWFRFLFVDYIPGRTGIWIRRLYWKKRFRKCGRIRVGIGCEVTSPLEIAMGEQVNIMRGVRLYADANCPIIIGNSVSINSNVYIDAHNGGYISIGDDVAIGPNAVLRASNHVTRRLDMPFRQQGHIGGKIIIGSDVWVAANVVILPGVTIGKGSVIAAGAVVTKDIPDNVLAGGIPAKVIKQNYRSMTKRP